MKINYKNYKTYKNKKTFQEGGKRLSKNYKKERPFFSIITTVKNNKIKLEKTIKSLSNQKFKNFEHLVIDGGSTDGTLEIIKKYDKKIDYWVSRNDKGIYHGFNDGLKFGKRTCYWNNKFWRFVY